MEIKKQVFYVLSIGLILPCIFIPMYAVREESYLKRAHRRGAGKYESARLKLRLYRKCIRGKCSEKEKQQVRADAAKVAKVTGLLAAAIAVIGGGFIAGRAARSEVRVNRVKNKYDLNLLNPSLKKKESELLYKFAWSADPNLKDLKRREFRDDVLRAAADLYLGLVPQILVSDEQLQRFLEKFELKE